MARVARVDYATARIDFKAEAVSPGVATATETPEGYVRVRAFLARDGLLTYGDGESTWLEYRPRESIVEAAASFAGQPVTDEHPGEMVDASTWADVAKGIVITTPRVTEIDGVSYLDAELLVTDKALIEKMRAGRDQLSIGFMANVTPTRDGRADDGTPCAAVQDAMEGNHVANVEIGRAGPACRAFLDSAAIAVHTIERDLAMKNKPVKDNLGAPVDMVEFPMPDGTVVEIPTTVAAMIEQLMAKAAEAEADAPGDEEPEGGAPSEDPPAPPSEEPAEEEEEEDTMEKPEEDKKPAASVGLSIDAAKAVIAKRMPWKKLDGADEATLAVLLETALEMPESDPEPKADAAPEPPAVDDGTNPFQQPAPVASEKIDAADSAALSFLARQGY